MSYPSMRSARNGKHNTTTPSPLRHASNISNSSTENSSQPNSFPPSRNSTISSAASTDYRSVLSSHKRPIGDTSPTKAKTFPDYHYSDGQGSPPRAPQNARQSLRQLPQAPNTALNQPERMSRRPPSPERTEDIPPSRQHLRKTPAVSEGQPKQAFSVGVGRSDSVRAKPASNGHHASQTNKLESSDLEKLGKSATGHLRALSQFAENGEQNDFSITSPEQEVVGMHGRRRLQRNMSTRGKKTFNTPGYGGKIWMDQQRQFLQAYEYLCHIGEAKEWIEDVIHKPIPPIVQLEEALRDGVTLAEIVQAIRPEKPLRIFRHARLQFRHSDNIAIFFKFLAEIELPELFRFELVDLYEKKNIPKVIYCIHALSWLLLRKGLVEFRIGNLVGQLEFEHHELEATQKGLDKAGVSMPNFSGMRENLGAPPEPPPQPAETEEERLGRELHEREDIIFELQAQVRGALLRMRLGDTMQGLWDSEEDLVDLQARIRGDFARQISGYRLQMRRFAVGLQSVSRGFLTRSRGRQRNAYWKDREKDVVILQSLLRARPIRQARRTVRSNLDREQRGIHSLQAAVRGALTRWDLSDQVAKTRNIEPIISSLQSHVRGLLCRKSLSACRLVLMKPNVQDSVVYLQAALRSGRSRQQQDRIISYLEGCTPKWANVQAFARARNLRLRLSRLRASLMAAVSSVVFFQSLARAFRQRAIFAEMQVDLLRSSSTIIRLESMIRGRRIRKAFKSDLRRVHDETGATIQLQAAFRGSRLRSHIYDLLCKFNDHESAIIDFQSVIRAMLLRSDTANLLENLEVEEEPTTELQTLARGLLVRQKFAEKKRFYNENMKKVVQIQSFVRARQQGDAYKSLTSGKNPPVNTVKNFVHLLNDSDFDFDEEVGKCLLVKGLSRTTELIRWQNPRSSERLLAQGFARTSRLSSGSPSSTQKLACWHTIKLREMNLQNTTETLRALPRGEARRTKIPST